MSNATSVSQNVMQVLQPSGFFNVTRISLPMMSDITRLAMSFGASSQ
jgi:hypothetical protein